MVEATIAESKEVLYSESADRTTQCNGSTDGVCWNYCDIVSSPVLRTTTPQLDNTTQRQPHELVL